MIPLAQSRRRWGAFQLAGDAMKKNHSLCMTLVVRLVIMIGAAVLYLRGRLTPERDAA
jgi:hypothetical protein